MLASVIEILFITRVDIALTIKVASSLWWFFWTKIKIYIVALLTLLSQMNAIFYNIPHGIPFAFRYLHTL